MSVSYLETQDLVKKFKRRTVVKNVSLNISQGEVVGLLGPNGAGKTTTFYMIVGMIRPNNGRVFLDGKDITSLPMYKRARYGIAYLAQESSIFRKLSVENNIMAILQLQKLTNKERKSTFRGIARIIRLAKYPKAERIYAFWW